MAGYGAKSSLAHPPAALDESPQDVVHTGLIASIGLPEPLQHVRVDADIDVLLSGWEAQHGLVPLRRLMHVIGIGGDAGLQLGLCRRIEPHPVGAALAAPTLPCELFSRIARGIVALL